MRMTTLLRQDGSCPCSGHTPGYYINSEILETSASMQYVFIGTDIPVQDRVSANIPYDAVSEAEKLLMRVKPGSILTLTIGGAQGAG